MKDFIVFCEPDIAEEDIQAVSDVLRSGWIGKGPKTVEFENIFKNRTDATGAVGLNSCTAALFLSLGVLGVGHGDEVITTPISFSASSNVIVHRGATPVFVDVEKDTGNIDPKNIESAITKKTKSLLVVHYAGRPCNMEAIMDIAKRNNLHVIEDCAHAIEAEYKGKKCGSFGDTGCFSFYATKNITCGEGGMLVFKNESLYERALVLSLHGLSKSAWKRHSKDGQNFYHTVEHGYKFNMHDISATMALSQYKRLEENWKKRRKNWEAYMEGFKDLDGIILPASIFGNQKHAYHLFTILLELEKLNIDREEFCSILKDKNIGTGVNFFAIHKEPAFVETLKDMPDLPNAEFISDRTVSIPVQPSLIVDQIEYIIKTIKEVIEENLKDNYARK